MGAHALYFLFFWLRCGQGRIYLYATGQEDARKAKGKLAFVCHGLDEGFRGLSANVSKF